MVSCEMTTSTDKAVATLKSISAGGEPIAPAPAAEEAGDLVARRRREAASRAAAEAAVRRAEAGDARGPAAGTQGERLGRGGLDPIRYGDWEVKGIATDF
jgi:hypothetical protein